jgi:hypothetical protein
MGPIKLFESKKVRTHWDEDNEVLYFSIIDVIEILTGTDRPRKYWNDLKTKLKKEGSELSEKIGQLKMQFYSDYSGWDCCRYSQEGNRTKKWQESCHKNKCQENIGGEEK